MKRIERRLCCLIGEVRASKPSLSLNVIKLQKLSKYTFVGKTTNSKTVDNLTVVILRTYQALIILDARECLLVMPNSLLYILCQNQNLQLIWRERISRVESYKRVKFHSVY